MNKPVLIAAVGIICAMTAVSSYAAAKVHKGIPEKMATEDFNVRKDALAQHIKDTIFRLTIEGSCVKAATTDAALDACQHDAPVADAAAKSKTETQPQAQTTEIAPAVPATPDKAPPKTQPVEK